MIDVFFTFKLKLGEKIKRRGKGKGIEAHA
jgi:hypothetical protein